MHSALQTLCAYHLLLGAAEKPQFSSNLQNQWPEQLCKPSPPRYQWIALTIYINLPKSISLSWICVFSLDVSWLCIRMKAGCTAPSVSRKHRETEREPWWVPSRSSSMGDNCELQWWKMWGNTPGFTVQMQPKWPAPGYKGTINASFLPFEIQQKYHAKIKTNKNSFIILPCTVSTNSLVIFPAILLATHV